MRNRSPIDVAVELHAAFAARNSSAITSLFAPDAVIQVAGSPDVPAVGTHRGQDAIRAFFSDLVATVTPQEMEVTELVASGRNVVALGHFRYRLERSGREYESDFALHLAVEGGCVQRYQMYEDSWSVARAFSPEPGATIRGAAGNRIDYLDVDCRTGEQPETDPIVLLHGLGCTWRVWSRQIPPLSARRRVVAVNCRGSGASEPGPPGLQISDLAADVHALLEQLRIPRAAVMGLSMGGMVALQHALDFPRDVARLLIVGSTAGVPDPVRAVAETQRRFIDEHEMGEIAESRMLAALGEDSDPGLRRWAVRMISAMDLASYRAQAHATFAFDVRQRLREIRVPTHVVHGENDRTVPLLLGRTIHEGIPGSKLHVVEGAGHFPNLEAPAAFNALVESILAGRIC